MNRENKKLIALAEEFEKRADPRILHPKVYEAYISIAEELREIVGK